MGQPSLSGCYVGLWEDIKEGLYDVVERETARFPLNDFQMD